MAEPTTRTAAETEAARAERAPSPAWSPGERNLTGQPAMPDRTFSSTAAEPRKTDPAGVPVEPARTAPANATPLPAHYTPPAGTAAASTEAASSRRTRFYSGVSPARRAIQMIWLLWLVADLVVGLRLVFKAVAANADAGFVSFIYSISGPLVAPFRPMVSDQGIGSNGVLEYSSIIAMVVFLAAALILTAFLRIVAAPRVRAVA
ncbi:MAG TPA: hypothetical protein VGQ42_06600 [Candidatus Dormibacteraeota bacterium]|jgi:uncharacterized protein YggT (Ycf19 family)|nr:hypothetical protein [Candidatus Dormibacteraeota bacterium]